MCSVAAGLWQGDEKDVLRAAESALDCFERVAVHGREDVGQVRPSTQP